jgi:hypothetical protein
LYCLSFYLWFLTFPHCIVCPSIYGFRFFPIVLSVLLFMVSDFCLMYVPRFVLLDKVRRVWRYQRGNHNPYIEDEQTTQWPKEKYKRCQLEAELIGIWNLFVSFHLPLSHLIMGCRVEMICVLNANFKTILFMSCRSV